MQTFYNALDKDKIINKGIMFFISLSIAFYFAQILYYLELRLAFTIVSFILIGIIFLYVLVFLNIEESLVVFFLVLSTRYVTGIGNNNELEDLILPFLYIGIIFLNKKKLKNSSIPLIFVLYSIFIIVTVIDGIKMPFGGEVTGFYRRWNYISALFCFLAGFHFGRKIDLRKFIRIIFWFYLVIMIITLTMTLFKIYEMPLFNAFSWRRLIDVDKERFGILSISGQFCFVILLVDKAMIRNKIVKYLIMILSVVALFEGGGRGSLLVVVFSIIAYFYFIRKKKKQIIFALVGATLFLLFFSTKGMENVLPKSFKRATDIINLNMLSYATDYWGSKNLGTQIGSLAIAQADESSLGRLIIWNQGFNLIIEKPFLGNSLENPYAGRTKKSLTSEDLYNNTALLETGNLHSNYLSIAYVFGIPCMLLFSLLFFRGIKFSYEIAINRVMGHPFIFMYFIGFLVTSFVADIYFSYEFMFMLGLVYIRHYDLINGK